MPATTRVCAAASVLVCALAAVVFGTCRPPRAGAQDRSEGGAAATDESARTLVWSVGAEGAADATADLRDAVAAVLAESGLEVLPEAQLDLVLSPTRRRTCRELGCALELAQELRVPVLATVEERAADGQAEHGQDEREVAVLLSVGPDARYAGVAPVGADRETAARAAVEEALAAWREAEGPSEAVAERSVEPEVPLVDEPGPSPLAERPLIEVILPITVLVGSAALLGLAIYALLPQTCEVKAMDDGVCLVGERPNIALGVVLVAIGLLGAVGGSAWLAGGRSPGGSMGGDFDVVQGPGDLGLGLRRWF